MWRWLAVLALMLAAGCTSTDYDFADVRQQRATMPSGVGDGQQRGPRFGDRKPHDWDGRAPWTYPVHGTDVSKYQGSVDWAALRKGNIRFAFIKATEGGDRVDDYFEVNWRNAKAAGIPRGAYHFYYFCRSAKEQAEWFIRNVPRDAGALPPVLDMEWNHLSPSCKLRPDAETVKAEMRVFLDIVTRHFGKKPIIYTSIDFYDDNRLDQFGGYDWWLRSVSMHPHDRYNRRHFLFWQYTGTGELPGVTGDADINVFFGTDAHWQAWLRSATR